MDFFQFLQNSKNDSVNIQKQKVHHNKNTKTDQIHHNTEQKTDQKDHKTKWNNEDITLYKNIQRGDFVKIIYVKDSPLNSYKGYIGEIRDYKKDQDSALVFLHPITSQCIVKFPLHHFYKIN